MTTLPPTRQPVDLLGEQAQTLQQINANLVLLNENQQRLALRLDQQDDLNERLSVKVENFNMPFMSMVGFLIKWGLASFVAALVFSVFFGALILLLTLALGMLGIALPNLFPYQP